MPNEPIQPQDKYVLRLPDGMRDRLKEAAAANKRSMNAEIVHRLNLSFDVEPDFTMESARNLAFSRERDEDKVPAPGDVVTIELQKAVRNAIEKAMHKLEDEGFITFLLDMTDVEHPEMYHKLAKRHYEYLKKQK